MQCDKSFGGGIFLLSSERSGTNLLRKRLAEFSSEICSIPPVHILRTLGYWEPIMGPFSDENRWNEVIRYALRCCYERAVPWPHQFNLESVKKVYHDLYGNDCTLVKLTDTLYRMYACQEDKSWYFCKDLWLFDFSEEIALQIPNVFFIHLFRDPRDYVVSQKQRPFGLQSAYTLAKLWQKECNAALKSCCSPSVRDKCLSFSYESLIQDENKFLVKICHAINVSPHSEKETSLPQTTHHDAYAFHEWKNLHLPTNKQNFRKYKKNLTSREIKVIESICWNTMKKVGYHPESTTRPKITFIDKLFTQYLGILFNVVKHQINRIKLRNEPINRKASFGLIEELTRKFR